MNLSNEITSVKDKIVECRDNLKQILLSKNVEVSDNEDKLSVLIDKVNELNEVVKPLYLYKEGNECNSITGGWKFSVTTNSSSGTVQVEKRNDSIYMKVVANSATGHGSDCDTVNLIDFTNYKTIHFDCDMGHSDEFERTYITIVNSNNTSLAQYKLKASTDLPRQIISLDVSNIKSGRVRLAPSTVWSGRWGEFILYNCWLEP